MAIHLLIGTATADSNHDWPRARGWLIAALFFLTCGVVAAADETAAGGTESHARIAQAAKVFLRKQLEGHSGRIEISMGAIDSRMRLIHCDRPLQTFLPPGGRLIGNASVGVRCDGPETWTLYVPARVSLIEDVLVARTYLPRGALLTTDQFEIAAREVSGAPQGYLTDGEAAVGMILKSPIQPGALISPAALKKPTLIRRGDQVDIVSRTGLLEVRMKGSALGDGAEGDRIRVRNSNSRRVVEGVVNEAGLVVVQM
jgi:flagella basal body P-ring formation protein FlgA